MVSQEVIQKFRDAKFGMFIHWGIYSVRSRGEWSIFRDSVPKNEYKKYQRMFNPIRFDAKRWVKCAKEAGMKYICITTKHHDGFCMFDSQYTDWKITNTPFGRDVIKEVVEACREEGLLVGLYYSIWDLWHEELDGGINDIGEDGEFEGFTKDSSWTPGEKGIEYMHNQVEELCTKYGEIDYFFFDVRRAPGECYRGEELIAKMRKWQPDMIINDRLGIPADCETPENRVPNEPIRDENGNLILWESCMCSNKNWSYVHDDLSFKTSEEIIRNLVSVVSKGGNYLLNVGPTALGEFPKENIKMLKKVGEWMDYHKESIYGCEMYYLGKGADHFRWRGLCATINKTEDMIYLHIPNYPASGRTDNKVCIPKLEKEIDYIVLLEDGCEVETLNYSYYAKSKNGITLILPTVPGHPAVTTAAIKLK